MSISPQVVRDYMEYIWRQINPYPQKWLGIIWNIWNKIFIIMMLATKFGALGKTLASVMEVEYPEMHLKEGALSASLISRHHLNVSCCRAGAGQGICNTKKRRADPSLGTAHYSNPPSPPIHSFPLVVRMLSNIDCINLFTFTLGTKCPGFR